MKKKEEGGEDSANRAALQGRGRGATKIRKEEGRTAWDKIPAGFSIRGNEGRGNCLFLAVAQKVGGDHLEVRRRTTEFMIDHYERFEKFWSEGESKEDFTFAQHLEA
eukprot:14271992-Heterocapsa_arctica.AAC.1